MYYWTSEFVSKGHPDKVADQIADSVLDLVLSKDRLARVAVEVTVTTHDSKNIVVLTGEVGCSDHAWPNYDTLKNVVSKTLQDIGYTTADSGFDCNNFELVNYIRKQSEQIANAVVKDGGEIGAGDQGMMFGFASQQSPTFMPLTHYLARKIILSLNDSNLFPDAKSQVTLKYEDGVPVHVDTVLVSTCHKDMPLEKLRERVRYLVDKVPLEEEKAIKSLFDSKTKYIINPAGSWTIGGPAADTGLSGRKIVVDNYGPDCPIGGGSFSGKDPTKVDRSAAYGARWLAKNIVASGIVSEAQVQLAYGIGIAEPISVRIRTNGSEGLDFSLTEKIKSKISLTPQALIDRFDLRRPIYKQTACAGHFGDNNFPWEKLDTELFKEITK